MKKGTIASLFRSRKSDPDLSLWVNRHCGGASQVHQNLNGEKFVRILQLPRLAESFSHARMMNPGG